MTRAGLTHQPATRADAAGLARAGLSHHPATRGMFWPGFEADLGQKQGRNIPLARKRECGGYQMRGLPDADALGLRQVQGVIGLDVEGLVELRHVADHAVAPEF